MPRSCGGSGIFDFRAIHDLHCHSPERLNSIGFTYLKMCQQRLSKVLDFHPSLSVRLRQQSDYRNFPNTFVPDAPVDAPDLQHRRFASAKPKFPFLSCHRKQNLHRFCVRELVAMTFRLIILRYLKSVIYCNQLLVLENVPDKGQNHRYQSAYDPHLRSTHPRYHT